MRLKSVTVSNYRIHRDCKVEFDPKLTLITGPNESGKSTLVEAIHRALFLRAKVGGNVLDEMKSDLGGTPGVELALEIGGQEGRLAKVFRGGRGSATLALEGLPPLHDDAAEDKLAELLHVGKPVDGRGAAGELPKRWAHLWVWQGQAGTSPTVSVEEQQQTLVQRLQDKGGAAVTQSDLDARVLSGIQARLDTLFTEKGEPRRGSDLARAEEELDSTQAALHEKQLVVQSLEEAVARYTRALNTVDEKTRTQAASSQELAEAERKLLRVEELRRALDPIRRKQEDAAAGIDELERVAKDLAATRQERDVALGALAPREQALEALRRDLGACREALQQAEKAWDTARASTASARLWKSALDAHLQALEKKQKLDELKADQAAIATKRTEQQAVRDEIAITPQVGHRDIAALQKLAQDLAAAEAAHAALGAKIEVVVSREPVSVDGRTVEVGACAVITTDAEVAIGSAATLRIRPGGNTGIAEARLAAETVQKKYDTKLASLSVATLEAATSAYENIRVLKGRCEALQADLERLNADENGEELRECEQAHAEAVRRAEHAARESGRTIPGEPAEAQASARASEVDCRRAEQVEKSAEASFKAIRSKCDVADAGVLEANADAEGLRRQVQDTTVRIQTIEGHYGTDAARADQLVDLRARHDQAAAEQAALQGQLDALQPEHLCSDVVRLKGAIRQSQDAINVSAQEKAAAEERLRLNGSTDPHEDLEKTRALRERAESRCSELRDQAEAVKHLAALAEEVQQSVAERINKPLEDAAQGYLECVFGAGSRAVLCGGLQAGEPPPLRISREQAGLGNFGFDALSGGAREQVGIAMRLAMAEVLAADHNGSLPIVLDDAFANSDPDRVRSLQRMLYRAAERGLQIIVLTCNPSDYSALGAKEIRLERPALHGTVPRASSPSGSDEIEELQPESSGAVSDEDKKSFIDKLASLGRKSGNQSLRDALAWTPERYEAAKEVLLEANAIALGQGRGGSVRLAEGQNERAL